MVIYIQDVCFIYREEGATVNSFSRCSRGRDLQPLCGHLENELIANYGLVLFTEQPNPRF